jgi:hypothetical protein
MGTATNVLMGAGNLYYGEKTDGNEVMSDLGYTRDGITVERTGTFYDINVDQEFSPIQTYLTAERVLVRTNLSESTRDNIKLAWGLTQSFTSSELSDVSGNNYGGQNLQFGGPSLFTSPNEWSILFVGRAPGTSKTRLIRMHRATAIDFGPIVHAKTGETVIPATFLCLADSSKPANTRVGYIFDET